MNKRECFKETVHHRKPEKVVVDLWGCPLSGISDNKAKELDCFLGYDHDKEKKRFNISEKALLYYDIDTRGVGNIIVPKKSHYKKISDTEVIDEWGIAKKFTGLYWDITDNPLRGKSYEEIEKYPFPDVDSIDINQLKEWRTEAKRLHEETDYAVCGSHPVYGVFEIACWLFGFDDLLLRMALEPKTIHMFFERFLNYQREVSDIYYSELGEYLDYTSSGDDFATQNSTFCSREMFRELIFPHFKERIRFTKAKTPAKFLHHSCGNVYSLIPDLIEAGVDILNPIQPVQPEMSARSLKSAYGGRIVFHGGFDTQQILVHGTSEEIREETSRLIKEMDYGNGYIFAAAHCIQDDVPVENIDAMFTAAKFFGSRNNRQG